MVEVVEYIPVKEEVKETSHLKVVHQREIMKEEVEQAEVVKYPRMEVDLEIGEIQKIQKNY